MSDEDKTENPPPVAAVGCSCVGDDMPPFCDRTLKEIGGTAMRRHLRGVLICLLLPWAALAQDASKLVPLLNYIAQPFEKDPSAMGYLASRCSALYSIFASKLRRQTDPESQRDAKLYDGLAEKFMGAAVQFKMTGTKLQSKDALTLTSNTVVGLVKLYVARIDSQKLLTNDMFDDELLETDNDVCMRFAKGFNPG